MNILFVAVFDEAGVSSNTSQAVGLEKLGHDVIRYNYRIRANILGNTYRDLEIIDICRKQNPDLVIFAKTNTVNVRVFEECKKYSKVCYWFPDPLVTYDNPEFRSMTESSDFFCCDAQKKNVFQLANEMNDHCFMVADGYDPDIEFPKDLPQDIDASFIGSLYGDRERKLTELNRPIHVFTSAFGSQHSNIVSRSKINLNFCTADSASDRTYKVLAAGGFYLTEDWNSRSDYFEDGKDIVVFDGVEDLRQKMDYYLDNEDERKMIAQSGRLAVEKFSRHQWAKRIVEIYEGLQDEI